MHVLSPLSVPYHHSHSAHSESRERHTRFGKNALGLLWRDLKANPLATISKNEVLNRWAIEVLGYDIWITAFARNQFERLENLLDYMTYWVIGIGGPVLMDMGFNRLWRNKVLTPAAGGLKFDAEKNPLKINLEHLQESKLGQLMQNLTPAEKQAYGLTELKPNKVIDFARKVRRGKLWIIALDLALLGAYNFGMFKTRNWMTEKLSGRKGFSGEFKVAQKEYLDAKTQAHQKDQTQREWLAVTMGTLVAPLSIAAGLAWTLKTKSASGVANGLRQAP